jgi:GntR family transcriptional regulator, transcriptional repressor for pyruvate dehydrogenase complex
MADRRRSLVYETVLEQIKADLMAGGLRSGDRLPTVNAMAHRMAVSPASVREAYRVLASMGLLEMTQGRGTFVSTLPARDGGIIRRFQLGQTQSLHHLFETRLVLEPPIAALAAERATGAEADAVVATAREQERLHREALDFLEPDIRFHELVLLCAHNPVMARMVSTVNALLLESRRRTMRIAGAADKAVRYHLLIGLAVREGDARQARALMEQHIRDVARDAGVLAETSAETPSSRPAVEAAG